MSEVSSATQLAVLSYGVSALISLLVVGIIVLLRIAIQRQQHRHERISTKAEA